jgi:hypothetical protein
MTKIFDIPADAWDDIATLKTAVGSIQASRINLRHAQPDTRQHFA